LSASKEALLRMTRNRPPLDHAVAQEQVRPADDAGAGSEVAVEAAGAHRRDAVDELGLADGSQCKGAVGLVEGAALHEHGRHDVVARAGVGHQLVQQVAPGVGDRGHERMLGGRGRGVVAAVP
jgi:hypothetical protein